jgi:hypothetical protein
MTFFSTDHRRALERRTQRGNDRIFAGSNVIDAGDALALHKQIILCQHHYHGQPRPLLGNRLGHFYALVVLQQLHFGRIHQQERHHHAEDVDHGNQVQLGVRPVTHLMLEHALGAIRHAHGELPPSIGASPIDTSGNSSACTVWIPALTSTTRVRSITCIRVS